MELPERPSRTFPYEVEKRIGEGAMGAVYLARETNLQRKVAIKTLRSDFLDDLDEEAAQEATRRFLQEARAIAQVSHRHIVSIYRLGTEDGSAFIAMEWLEGETLGSLIKNNAPVPAQQAGRWALQLLEGIGAAHRRDIVHRDIKPENVIIDADDQVKLTDFGVAQVRNSGLVQTQAGSIVGTPLYAAPEQLSDSRVDRRADLYSIGVVLFEMLTGEVPFYDDNVVRLINQITSEPPPPLRKYNPSAPAELEQLLEVVLAKQPSERFNSARKMAQALVELLPDLAGHTVSHSGTQLAETHPMDADDNAEAIRVEGTDPTQMVTNAVTGWEPKPVGPTSTDRLLERLMESPVHADPFAGAAKIDDHLFLISQGLVYGAVDVESGESGDVVYETRPPEGRATLFELPDVFDERLIPAISSLLYRPDRKHSDLETAFTDMVSLYGRLCREQFDGAIRLEEPDGEGLAFLLIHRGEPLLDLFSTSWEGAPHDRNWQSWIEGKHLTAHVEHRRTRLSAATYRRELSDLQVTVGANTLGEESTDIASTAKTGEFRLSPMNLDGRSSHNSTVWKDIYESDVAFRLLSWLREDVEDFLTERGRAENWKYLANWIDLIDTANLYHELERPGGEEADFFDLVTFDEAGKALHLGRRVAQGNVEQLNAFIDDVEAAKKARIKTGDIGGAILVADEFEDRMIDAYLERVEERERSWFFNLQESMTGYEGFVRMGARRGFHLLLVRRDGPDFDPILPPKK